MVVLFIFFDFGFYFSCTPFMQWFLNDSERKNLRETWFLFSDMLLIKKKDSGWFLSKLEPRFLFLKMSVVIFIHNYFFKVKQNIDFCFVFKLSSSSQNWHYWFWFWTITGPGLAALWHANTQPETDQSWLNPGNQKLKCQTNAGTGPMLAFLYWTITLCGK